MKNKTDSALRYTEVSSPDKYMEESRSRARKNKILAGLAGQQNAGKSTTFNMVTGANQHIANYPGVTVDKKSGFYRDGEESVEVVDLPGTYSLTSFSLEERVTRDFILTEAPDALINVVDASSLKRSLYFTFQIIEMEFPIVVALNMMDVASQQGLEVDTDKLSELLGLPVVPCISRARKGRDKLKAELKKAARREEVQKPVQISYGALEKDITHIAESLKDSPGIKVEYPLRWLAVKLLEQDSEALRIVRKYHPEAETLIADVELRTEEFENEYDISPADFIVTCRDELAGKIYENCVDDSKRTTPVSEKVDRVLLNRVMAPFFLLLTVFTIYELAIVQGYKLTEYTWPFLAKFRDIVAGMLPDAGMLQDSLLRSMGLWMVDSANTLLNYVPIFFILFILIAILEDSGYMARIAFILDRIFHSFGLHGQSTLPFILGGIFAGGCAVPGIMATKGIPDERSRLATILTVPFMNCLAKIPLLTLLVNVYFFEHKSFAMLFISTITICMALLIAKFLTSVVLKSRETAPFMMEMPNYHWPTLFGVLQRSFERTWEYIKKVGSIVVAVSICVFTLLQFPGLDDASMAGYEKKMDAAVAKFEQKLSKSQYADTIKRADILPLMEYYSQYKLKRMMSGASGRDALNAKFKEMNPDFFAFVRPKGKEGRSLSRALRRLSNSRKRLRRQMKEETITNSFFGQIGRSLEPVTKFAGFDWKINVALISSFAARESSVATLGVLFQKGADDNQTLEQRMGSESKDTGKTPLAALAIMVFFLLYPPCLATTVMVKVQTGSYKWMLFAILFPTGLGFAVSSAIYSLGRGLSISGFNMMTGFYALVVCATLAIATLKNKTITRSEFVPLPSDLNKESS